MTITGMLTLALGLCLSLLLFVRGLRTVLILLTVVLLGTVGLIAQSLPAGIEPGPATLLLAMDLATVVTAMGILVVAGFKDHRAGARPPRRLTDSLVASAVLLVILSFTLWGNAPMRVVDFAWMLLLVSGHVLMIRAYGLLDVGVGLMVLLFGIKLLHIVLIVPLGIAELGVLNITVIIAAMIVAYAGDVLLIQSDGDGNHRTS